ncbi:hypothetical protein QFZ42_002409 [Variovorax paradoxus]|jgi:hypothetical protein|uniref:hypothetical protein n=1 Tax=Variovorax paradoxus TaxID=34073 RepID=UPI002790B336|nr:hypothetical protein [Variovorax paradoxus]MDQ0570575.1 hypothetical protein [Variovorax paradoxus]
MTKKQTFLRQEQSRDKHPERDQVGSPAKAATAAGAARGTPEADAQTPHSGKLANDHNKMGQTQPTQLNQGRRTPASRHDRQTMGAGPQNQISARKGGGGAGRTPRGAG